MALVIARGLVGVHQDIVVNSTASDENTYRPSATAAGNRRYGCWQAIGVAIDLCVVFISQEHSDISGGIIPYHLSVDRFTGVDVKSKCLPTAVSV